MSSRVFFAAYSDRFDVSDVRRYGEPVYLLERQRPHATEVQSIVEILHDRLSEENFDPDVDYVAVTGPTVYVALLVADVLATCEGARLLVFDAPKDRYEAADLETCHDRRQT